MSIDISRVNPLKDRKQYRVLADAAGKALLALHPEPEIEKDDDAISEQDAKFRRNVERALWALVVIAFVLSAIKQYISSDSVLSPLVSDWWFPLRAGVVLACLFFGEIGAMLFSVAAGVIARNLFTKIVFRAASLLCAGMALVANISATQLHHDAVDGNYFVYMWVLTILPPTAVLVLASILEHFQREDREKSKKKSLDHRAALAQYRAWKASARKSQEYRDLLRDEIVLALRALDKGGYNSEAIDAIDGKHGDDGLDALLARELRKYDRDLLTDAERAATTPDQPQEAAKLTDTNPLPLEPRPLGFSPAQSVASKFGPKAKG